MSNMRELFQKYAAVVFFDTETTGLDAESCRIIELAAMRVEQAEDGTLQITRLMDVFINLPDGQKVPERIVELTGITDDILNAKGAPEATAAALFTVIISNKEGPVLLVAHNAQFDLLFVREMLKRHFGGEQLARADYLDSLTVYRDRRAYPHHLANAITDYNLEDKVINSHRADDDTIALFEVVKAMANERADLDTYVNVFGYNPKYEVSGYRIDKVTYWAQRGRQDNYMCDPSDTLPEKARRGQK